MEDSSKPPKRISWSLSALSLIGRIPDAELARRLRLTPAAVRKKRMSLDIPPHQPRPEPVHLDDKQLRQLSTEPDQVLAERWGVSRTVVTTRRVGLGIPPYRRSGKAEPEGELPRAARRLLGKVPDVMIARDLGLPIYRVRARRVALGIETVIEASPIVWTKEMIADLRRLPASSFEAKHSVSEPSIYAKRQSLGLPQVVPRRPAVRWTSAMIDALGTASDVALASRWNLARSSVQAKRAALGIRRWGLFSADESP